MVIKETSVFTRQVSKLLDAESYRLLQLRLAADPEAGDLIRGTGGLRKIRWQGSGRGKRGKSDRDDLSADQKRVLVALVKEEFK